MIGALASAKTPEEQKGYDKSKDLGVKAPAGADTPFDGTMASIKKNWVMWPKKDMDVTWKIVKSPTDDSKVLMTDGGKKWGTHDLVTKKTYHDFEGHVEFIMMGARGDDKAEGYANSGVYMQNRHELQIESPKGKNTKDPYNWKIGPHGIAAVCMEHVPTGNAWRPNGQWHSFHFIFKAAEFETGRYRATDQCVTPKRRSGLPPIWRNNDLRALELRKLCSQHFCLCIMAIRRQGQRQGRASVP